MASDQGFEYFSAHVKMNKNKVNISLLRNGNLNSMKYYSTILLN